MARANEGEVVWVAVDVWHPLAVVVVVRMAVAVGATSWSARSEAVEEEEVVALLLEVVREPEVCWSVLCFEEVAEKASAPRRPTPAQHRPTLAFAVVVKVETVAGCGSLEAALG